jgi:glycosyltransferase involved in cell wall biosynthesis
MKILIINDYGYVVGGADVHIFQAIKILKERGYDIRLFTTYSAKNIKLVNYTSIGYKNKLIYDIFNPLYYFNIFSYFKLKQVIREFKPDILHFHNILYELSPSVYKFSKNIPSLIKVPDYYLVCPKVSMMTKQNKICDKYFSYYCFKFKCISRKSNFIRFIFESVRMRFIRKYIKNIKVITTPSDFMKNVVSRLYKNKIVTLNNFVEMQKTRKYNPEGDILYVGRLVKTKGIQNLIEAYSKINSIGKRKLIIIGEGNSKQNLKQLSVLLKLDKKVIFMGKKTNLKKYYSRASLVVVPSIWPEPFGIVIIEAMSYGIPVIGSNIGGIPEIINNNKTGYLVKPNDVDDLKNKIELFFSNQNRMIHMSQKSFDDVKQYSKEVFAKRLIKIYNSIKCDKKL